MTTQEGLLEGVVALCGVLTKMSPEASRARYGNRGARGAEEDHQGDEGEGGEKESREKESRAAGQGGGGQASEPRECQAFRGCGGSRRREMRMMFMRASIRVERVLAAVCSGKAFAPAWPGRVQTAAFR